MCTPKDSAPSISEAQQAQYERDWQAARTRAGQLAQRHGLTLDALAKIPGLDIAIDFHRVLNAGDLAAQDLAPHAAL